MSRWKLILTLVLVVLVAVVGYRAATAGKRAAGKKGGEEGPVPVTVVTVTQADVPVFLEALGTVQALNSVTVRPQVSGQIEAIGYKEGQEIAKDSVIAQIDPRSYQASLDQALAKKKQDQAQLASARSTLSRYDELIAKGYVSKQDMENQRNTVAQYEALVVADDAAIASARVQLGYTTIRAPFTGLAGIRNVDLGNLVQAGQADGLVTLTQVHPINVVFTLPEQALDELRGSGSDALQVTAVDRSDQHPIAQGELRVIDNQIDSATGTFRLKAEFANDDNVLWPGQFVNVRLQLRTANGPVIPAPALQRGPDGSYVYVVQDDQTVQMQPVQTGTATADGRLLVLKGLAAGQRVVTEGQFRLKPGAKVQALAPGQQLAPAAPPMEGKTKPAAAGG